MHAPKPSLNAAHDSQSEQIGLSRLLVPAVNSVGIDYGVGGPDSGLTEILGRLQHHVRLRYVSRENVAVAAAAGAYLGGSKPLVFMKNCGLGTSLDALMSLARASRVPMILMIGWAGVGSDSLPHHVVMGTRTTALLDASGIGWKQLNGETTNSIAKFVDGAFLLGEIRALLMSP